MMRLFLNKNALRSANNAMPSYPKSCITLLGRLSSRETGAPPRGVVAGVKPLGAAPPLRLISLSGAADQNSRWAAAWPRWRMSSNKLSSSKVKSTANG